MTGDLFDDLYRPRVEPMPPFTGVQTVTRDTSRDAAASVKASAASLRERLYAAILARPDGLTDDEAQVLLSMDGNTQRPRRRELEQAGRIQASGTRQTASGRSAVVWKACGKVDGRA